MTGQEESDKSKASGKEDSTTELEELEELVMKKAGVHTSSDAPAASASTLKSSSLAPSTATPGAFAVDNPLRGTDESATQPSVADSSSVPNTAYSSSAAVATATSLTTAEPVSITVADPINNETEDETSKSEGTDSNVGEKNQNTSTRIIVVLCLVLAIVVIAVAVSLTRPQKPDPMDERMEAMKEFLSRITPMDAYEGTSKYNADRKNALMWITQDDPMQLPIPASDVPNSDPLAWKLLDRYAVAVLYFSTNGEQWTQDFSFLSGIDVCRWSTARQNDDFFQSNEFEIRGIVCDDDGRVTAIRLCKSYASEKKASFGFYELSFLEVSFFSQ